MTILNGQHADANSFMANFVGRDGWVLANATWNYVSETSFWVTGDKTAEYVKGMKFKATMNGVKKQGHFVSSSYNSGRTTTTTIGDALTNHTISLNYYSPASLAVGFPTTLVYTSTGISATNSVITAKYSLAALFCRVDMVIQFTGGITFTSMPTLPFTVSSAYSSMGYTQVGACGEAGYNDSGTGYVNGALWPVVAPSGTVVNIMKADGSPISASAPITWANNDFIELHFGYPIG